MSTMMLSDMIRHHLGGDSAEPSSTTSSLAESIPQEPTGGSAIICTTSAPKYATYIRGSPTPRYRGRGANKLTSRQSLRNKKSPTNLAFDNQEDFERWVNTRGKHNHRVTREQEEWLWSVTGPDAVGKVNWERCSQECFKLFDEKWNGSRLMMEWYRIDRKMKTSAAPPLCVKGLEEVTAKKTDTSSTEKKIKRKATIARITAPSIRKKRSSRGQRVNYAEDKDYDPEDDLGNTAGHEAAADEVLKEAVRPNSGRATPSKELVLDSITLNPTPPSPQPCKHTTQADCTSINGLRAMTDTDIVDIQTTGHVQSGVQEISSATALIPIMLDLLKSPTSSSTELTSTQENPIDEGDRSIKLLTEIENELPAKDPNSMKEMAVLDSGLQQTTRAIRRSIRLLSTPTPPKVLHFKSSSATENNAAANHYITGDLHSPPATPATPSAKPSIITAQAKFMRIYTYSAAMGKRRPDADVTFGPSVPGDIPSKPTTIMEGLAEILQALEFSPIRRDIIIFTDCAEAVRKITAATFRSLEHQDNDILESGSGELLGKILGALREREEAESTTRFEWIEGLRDKAPHANAKL